MYHEESETEVCFDYSRLVPTRFDTRRSVDLDVYYAIDGIERVKISVNDANWMYLCAKMTDLVPKTDYAAAPGDRMAIGVYEYWHRAITLGEAPEWYRGLKNALVVDFNHEIAYKFLQKTLDMIRGRSISVRRGTAAEFTQVMKAIQAASEYPAMIKIPTWADWSEAQCDYDREEDYFAEAYGIADTDEPLHRILYLVVRWFEPSGAMPAVKNRVFKQEGFRFNTDRIQDPNNHDKIAAIAVLRRFLIEVQEFSNLGASEIDQILSDLER